MSLGPTTRSQKLMVLTGRCNQATGRGVAAALWSGGSVALDDMARNRLGIRARRQGTCGPREG